MFNDAQRRDQDLAAHKWLNARAQPYAYKGLAINTNDWIGERQSWKALEKILFGVASWHHARVSDYDVVMEIIRRPGVEQAGSLKACVLCRPGAQWPLNQNPSPHGRSVDSL